MRRERIRALGRPNGLLKTPVESVHRLSSVVSLQHMAANRRSLSCVRSAGVRNMFSVLLAEPDERGAMEEVVGRIVANLGIERPVAEQAVGIILDFLATEGPPDKVQTLIARLPGGAQAIEEARAAAGGGMSGGMGGVMGVGSRLMAAGLNMGEIQGVSRELISYAREKAGDDDIDGIVAAIPGLSQFI
jgi:hypothetical protein